MWRQIPEHNPLITSNCWKRKVSVHGPLTILLHPEKCEWFHSNCSFLRSYHILLQSDAFIPFVFFVSSLVFVVIIPIVQSRVHKEYKGKNKTNTKYASGRMNVTKDFIKTEITFKLHMYSIRRSARNNSFTRNNGRQKLKGLISDNKLNNPWLSDLPGFSWKCNTSWPVK